MFRHVGAVMVYCNLFSRASADVMLVFTVRVVIRLRGASATEERLLHAAAASGAGFPPSGRGDAAARDDGLRALQRAAGA